ncbi:MAG TPA: porin [Thermoanaerobaculia bacterium]|jgi:phosphate-selective porin OprO/OprP|nr:porin [Thermoanaerobaculia bacterium]
MREIGLALFCAWLTIGSADMAAAQEPAEETAEETTEAATEAESPKSVEERLDELDQKVRVLDRKSELDKEQAAEKAKTAGQITAGKDGFTLKSADGAFQLKIRGYTQLDGRFYNGDDERPANDTFLLRRIRPNIEGTLFKIFDFRIMPDFAQGQTVLFDGYLEGRFSPAFKVRAGKFKPPVGLERLQSATDTFFAERAFPTSLVPNRDVGIQLSGDLAGGGVNYAIGYFNGVPDGANGGDVDAEDDKDLAARLFFTPFAKGGGTLKGLGFGVAASQGSTTGSATATGLPGYRTPGQQTFFSYRTDAVTPANTAFADGDRTRFSPQGYLYIGQFGLLTEYVQSSQEVRRGTVVEELENEAWQVAASWVLAGGEPSFRGVNPKTVFDPTANTWGAFEVVARISSLDVDDKAFPLFANPASAASAADSIGLGFNWYLNRNLKLMLDYERTEFEGGASIADGGDREDESVLFSRFQIAF